MTKQPKEWRSFAEQLEILKSRGMGVDDDAKAIHYLSRIGYYRLSGYWHPFRVAGENEKKKGDNFLEGTNFDNVLALYNFDRELRLLILDALEKIELSIQVELAHKLGERDIFAHLNPDIFHTSFARLPDKRDKRDQRTQHEKWIEKYRTLVDRSKNKKFVKHNIDKYGELPIWVAIEVFDFGTLSKLFAGLKIQDRIDIERQFGLSEGKHLHKWLRSLTFIRNVSAHHTRLWNCNVNDRSSAPRAKFNLFSLNNSRPFLYFCLAQTLLRIVAPDSSWGQKFIRHVDNFPEFPDSEVNLSEMGVPNNNWRQWTLWR